MQIVSKGWRQFPTETVCMNCQNLFSGKNKKKKNKQKNTSLSSAELAQRVIKIKVLYKNCSRRLWFFFNYFSEQIRLGISCEMLTRNVKLYFPWKLTIKSVISAAVISILKVRKNVYPVHMSITLENILLDMFVQRRLRSAFGQADQFSLSSPGTAKGRQRKLIRLPGCAG